MYFANRSSHALFCHAKPEFDSVKRFGKDDLDEGEWKDLLRHAYTLWRRKVDELRSLAHVRSIVFLQRLPHASAPPVRRRTRAPSNAIDDLWEMQGFFTEQALVHSSKNQDKISVEDSAKDPEKVVEAWFADNDKAFTRLMPLLQEARGNLRLPMVMVLMRTFHQTASALTAVKGAER